MALTQPASNNPLPSPASVAGYKKPRRAVLGYYKFKDGLLNVKPIGDEIAIVTRNAQESPLLRLPPEIRSMIWKYAICGNFIRPEWSTETMKLPKFYSFHNSTPPRHRFGLLRVNRQIYSEAALLAHIHSTFRFSSFPHLRTWLYNASASDRKAIYNLQLGQNVPLNHAVRKWGYLMLLEKGLRRLPNLRTFELVHSPREGLQIHDSQMTVEVLDTFKAGVEGNSNVRVFYKVLLDDNVWMRSFKNGSELR